MEKKLSQLAVPTLRLPALRADLEQMAARKRAASAPLWRPVDASLVGLAVGLVAWAVLAGLTLAGLGGLVDVLHPWRP